MNIQIFLVTALAFSTLAQSFISAEVPETIRNRFLLIDSRIVEKVTNAKLVVGTVKKHPANPLFAEDRPWEKRFDNLYGNVIYDDAEKLYKIWYSPFIVDSSAQGMSMEERQQKPYYAPDNREMAICYATSKDGIAWVKPELGLVDYEGSKANNILWRGSGDQGEHWEGPHGAGIFKDLRDPDPNRRYKAILKAEILSVGFSADGIHWGPAIACPAADVAGDTHNNAFWAPTLGKYVGITREWFSDGQKGWRQVARIESANFVDWTSAKVVLEGSSQDRQTYAMPVFYYGGIYLGLLAVHEQSSDRVWTELTWSADTKNWHRVSEGTALIPASEKELDYDYGCVYTCAYPVFLKNEIRLYYGGSDWLHFGWRNGFLALATLRPDGFAGYEQQSMQNPAIITTAAIPYAGQSLQISADVAQGGSVQVFVIDTAGNQVSSAKTISRTVSDAGLEFDRPFSDDHIRLKFDLDKAKLYSFSFAE